MINKAGIVPDTLVVKSKLSKFAVKVIRAVFIIGLCYLFLFPVFYMVSVSLTDPSNAFDPSTIWIPKKLSLVAIKGAMEALNYGESTFLTVKISVFSTAAALISCSLAGYGISRFKFRGKTLVYVMVFLTILVPPQLLITSNYVSFRYFDFSGLISLFKPITGVESINLLNSEWTYILPSIFASGLRNGLFILIFSQFFKGLPKELEESAKIDGSGTFRTFISIILPLSTSAFITVLLFSFVWHWNEYYNASAYFTLDVKPLSVMLDQLSEGLGRGGYITDLNQYETRMFFQAGALLSILPPLVIYIFTQRYFTESIERTGIVG